MKGMVTGVILMILAALVAYRCAGMTVVSLDWDPPEYYATSVDDCDASAVPIEPERMAELQWLVQCKEQGAEIWSETIETTRPVQLLLVAGRTYEARVAAGWDIANGAELYFTDILEFHIPAEAATR